MRLTVVVLVLLLGGMPGTAQAAEPDRDTVKYYVVAASYQGRPERLWDIAARVLRDGARYLEIFELNRDRPQPGGGRLADPNVLEPGWLLVLPWDAAGVDVHVGQLPMTAPELPQGVATTCGTPSTSSLRDIPWAQLRLAPNTVWPKGRGQGVTVAVIDSGVDATVPALSGRILPGVDVTPGGKRGDHDCVGHGTAVAALLAAQPTREVGLVGMAPEATILPIRVEAGDGDQAAAAVRVALAAHADIIVTPVLPPADGALTAALAHAAEEDTVVVVAASTGRATVSGDVVIRVGAVGIDGRLADDYGKDLDVVAPGVDIVSLGLGGRGTVKGTGADYAAAFVAGLAALLRSIAPDASATEIVQRILASADPMLPDQPDLRYGRGFINPAAAAGLSGSATDGASDGATQNLVLDRRGYGIAAGIIALAIVVAVGLVVRARRGQVPPVVGE